MGGASGASVRALAVGLVLGRRSRLEVLADILRVLVEEGAAGKTLIMRRANLNTKGFSAHVEDVACRLGLVKTGLRRGGRRVYYVTGRGRRFYTLLAYIVLLVEEGIGRDLAEEVAGVLAGKGCSIDFSGVVRGRSGRLYYHDFVAKCDGIVVAVDAILGDGIDDVLLGVMLTSCIDTGLAHFLLANSMPRELVMAASTACRKLYICSSPGELVELLEGLLATGRRSKGS